MGLTLVDRHQEYWTQMEIDTECWTGLMSYLHWVECYTHLFRDLVHCLVRALLKLWQRSVVLMVQCFDVGIEIRLCSYGVSWYLGWSKVYTAFHARIWITNFGLSWSFFYSTQLPPAVALRYDSLNDFFEVDLRILLRLVLDAHLESINHLTTERQIKRFQLDHVNVSSI